jgi:predicted RNA binding protein YcfA (HicA-like mRNA interferase family)
MKLPRDVSGPDLVQAFRKLGYQTTRQKGSHIRVTTEQMGQHHEVIPNHSPVKPGTLHGILKSVASHHKMTVEELIITLKL